MNWPLITTAGHFLYKLVAETLRKARRRPSPPSVGPGTDMAKCARCHTYVPASGTIRAQVGGYTLHFCSRECFEAYRRDHRDIDAIPLDK